MKDVAEISDERVTLSTGTLYGALRRLLQDGWIERFSDDDTSRGRQAYRLTGSGQRILQREVLRMKQLTRLASRRVKEA
jgi:DNA-binding PadR family transcriptional regulator